MKECGIKKIRYEEQENLISRQSEEFIKLLTQKGILEDPEIKDARVRQAKKDTLRNMHHNTEILLQNYRNIVWALECFPDTVAAELDEPMEDLDSLLDRMDAEIGMGNRKLESRLQSIRKSRLLLDRINEALSILKRKPDNGERMYELIYLTYITDENLTHMEIIDRMGISSRHYYRIRKQAFSILSLRLWSAPASEIDSWLEVMAMLENG